MYSGEQLCSFFFSASNSWFSLRVEDEADVDATSGSVPCSESHQILILSFSAWRCGSLSFCLREPSLNSRWTQTPPHHSETSPLPSAGLCPALQKNGLQTNDHLFADKSRTCCLCCPCCICPSKILYVFLDELCTLFLLMCSDHDEVFRNKKQLPANPKSRRFYENVQRPFCCCVQTQIYCSQICKKASDHLNKDE